MRKLSEVLEIGLARYKNGSYMCHVLADLADSRVISQAEQLALTDRIMAPIKANRCHPLASHLMSDPIFAAIYDAHGWAGDHKERVHAYLVAWYKVLKAELIKEEENNLLARVRNWL